MRRQRRFAFLSVGLAALALSAPGCGRNDGWPSSPSYVVTTVAAFGCTPIGCWRHRDVARIRERTGAGAFFFSRGDANAFDLFVRFETPVGTANYAIGSLPVAKPALQPRVFLKRLDGRLVEVETSFDSEQSSLMAVQIPANFPPEARSAEIRILHPGGNTSVFRLRLPAEQPVSKPDAKPSEVLGDIGVRAEARSVSSGPNGELPLVAGILTVDPPDQPGVAVSVREWAFEVPEWKLHAQMSLGRLRSVIKSNPARLGAGFSDAWIRDPQSVVISGTLVKEHVVEEPIDFGSVPVKKQRLRGGDEDDAYTLAVASIDRATPSGLRVSIQPARILDRDVTDSSTIHGRLVVSVVIDDGAATGLDRLGKRTGPVTIEFAWPDSSAPDRFLRPEFNVESLAMIGGDLGIPPNASSARVRLIVRRRVPYEDWPFRLVVPSPPAKREDLGLGQTSYVGTFRFRPDSVKLTR